MAPRQSLPKRGSVTGHGGFRKISGARTRVAVGQSGFPVSIRTSPANVHDSTKSADVMENISEFMDDDGTIKQIASVYADKKGGYDSTAIRSYLKNRNPIARIPFRKNGKSSERTNHTRNIIRFDALRRDSLVGSKTDFTGQESDMKRDVKTVLRLLVLDHF